MYCKNCGAPVEPNDKFCKHCGAAQEQKQSQYYYNQNSHITFDQVSGSSNDSFVYGRKSRVLAAILALLTNFGIYNFYLGYKKKAIIQLIISIVAFVFSIFANVVYLNYGEVLLYYILNIGYIITGLTVGIWSLVDAIRLFARKLNFDGKGNPLI